MFIYSADLSFVQNKTCFASPQCFACLIRNVVLYCSIQTNIQKILFSLNDSSQSAFITCLTHPNITFCYKKCQFQVQRHYSFQLLVLPQLFVMLTYLILLRNFVSQRTTTIGVRNSISRKYRLNYIEREKISVCVKKAKRQCHSVDI